MLNRKLISKLSDWKTSSDRKPLLIRGARQVGKTTLIRWLSKEFDNYLELNLEKSTANELFRSDDVEVILRGAFFLNDKTRNEGSTLLFLDEIQESVAAIKMLRYLYEELPDVHIIAAGSLLEFAMNKIESFPVGRVDYLYLHPMNFPEFLEASNKIQALQYLNEIPIPDFAHATILDIFHDFVTVGGMPEVVDHFVRNQNITALIKIYNRLWQSYKGDAEKYARNKTEQEILRHILATAPYQSDRIKFEGFGNSNYRSREVGEALRSVDLSRLIRLVYPCTELKPPALPDLKKRPRLQFLDTGMLNQILLRQSELIHVKDLNQLHKGRITHHMINQELISIYEEYEYNPMFWVREKSSSNSEIDLVFTFNDLLIPIEVKSGKQGKLRSLHEFIERADHPYAIRMHAGNFGVEQYFTPKQKKKFYLMNLPYYLGTRIPEYVAYFVKSFN